MFINLKCFVFSILIVTPLLVNSSNVRKRKRPTIEQPENIETVSKLSEIVPDQLALATRPNYINNNFKSSSDDSGSQFESQYDYGNSDVNIIVRTQNHKSKRYGRTPYKNENQGIIKLDDSQTAEEYVSKAMQNHGTQVGNTIEIEAKLIPSSTARNIYKSYDENETKQESFSLKNLKKDAVTRSYDVYDYGNNKQSAYDTKYNYPTDEYIRNYQTDQTSGAASSEIPKHEILKQIEKSVIKYMKELVAEGKIPIQQQKTYYEIQSLEGDKTPLRTKSHHSHHPQTQSSSTTIRTTVPKQSKLIFKDHEYHHKTVPVEENVSENYDQNVEFTYDTKPNPPSSLHKHKIITSSSIAQHHLANFDHSSALKNLEDFDMPHVVSEDRPAKKKLYFNSDIYHDINSLPYKSDKFTHDRVPLDHKKSKESVTPLDYKGYTEYPKVTHHEPKFIALTEYRASVPTYDRDNNNNNEGYPVMNPYQFVLSKKREPNSNKHSESPQSVQSSSWLPYSSEKDQIINNYDHEQRFDSPQKALNFDSYSPKFNHNPDNYGYQHSYKQTNVEAPLFQGHRQQKRRKRGGNNSNTHNKKKINNTNILAKQDIEANSILRPPPHNI